MPVWCHASGCDNLIRNDEEFLGTEPGNRSHVQVSGVPFCMDCYSDHGPGPSVVGIPVREVDVTVVLGGYPASGGDRSWVTVFITGL
jgi:hypothetical protein